MNASDDEHVFYALVLTSVRIGCAVGRVFVFANAARVSRCPIRVSEKEYQTAVDSPFAHRPVMLALLVHTNHGCLRRRSPLSDDKQYVDLLLTRKSPQLVIPSDCATILLEDFSPFAHT